jgi:hypothetical protein
MRQWFRRKPELTEQQRATLAILWMMFIYELVRPWPGPPEDE